MSESQRSLKIENRTSQDDEISRDRLEILGHLGHGSFGEVYKCRDVIDSSIFAVKVIPIKDEDDISDFFHEVEVMKRCRNPHVLGYRGCFRGKNDYGQDALWIVIEYCEAGSISDLFRISHTPINEELIAGVLQGALFGLRYLHENRMIHRDIKAANILINAQGIPKLADFGVSARLTVTQDKRSTAVGTPYWMAPEVIRESFYNESADIWSIGITAIELAEKRPPLYKIHPMKAIFLIARSKPPTFADPSRFSPEFVDFVTLCLQKDPTARPSVSELLTHPFIAKSNSELLREIVSCNLPIIEEKRKCKFLDDEMSVSSLSTNLDHESSKLRKSFKTSDTKRVTKFPSDLGETTNEIQTMILLDASTADDFQIGNQTSSLLDGKRAGVLSIERTEVRKAENELIKELVGHGNSSIYDHKGKIFNYSQALWVPDDYSQCCMICKTHFTFFRRRHHCRQCGILICYLCSPFKKLLPNVDIKYPVRVCSLCCKK